MILMYRKFLFTHILLLSAFYSPCQQLVLNGNFEDINVCTEFHALCSPEAWRLTSQERLNSLMYDSNHFAAVVVCNSSVPDVRSYIETRLGDSLHPGRRYKFSMDVQPGHALINSIGVLLSDTLILTPVTRRIHKKPDIDFTTKKELIGILNRHTWTHLEKEFTATSATGFILIGCFNPDEELNLKYEKGKKKDFKDYIYLIDNVSITPVDTRHDTAVIRANKEELYAINERHPEPVRLFDWPKRTLQRQKQALADTILLANDLLFGVDSYHPSPYFNRKLDTLFANFKGNIDSISIIGHTDNTGPEVHNDELSVKRAETVANYIAAHWSITPGKIKIEGKGSREPVADNDSPEGRNQNRRVEVIINYSMEANPQKE
ncbi:MAG TPA: OmpA family protein [Chitinophagaceae bacterium]|nr:OmpA family protein [Chitinophagaceae bacterium]